MVSRSELVSFLDKTFSFYKGEDDSCNGLQYEGEDSITKAAFAVDACLSSFEAAAQSNADFLFVHHGLFWKKNLPEGVTGIWRKRLDALAEKNLSLYAVHLPLDAHPKLGNNAVLAGMLALKRLERFGEYHGEKIALKGVLPKQMKLFELRGLVEKKLGVNATVYDFGSAGVRRVGVCSGGGAFAAGEGGIDCLVTGEVKHSDYHAAKDAGVNVIEAGHYVTETLGVKAVQKLVEKKFGIKTVFLDLPTGL